MQFRTYARQLIVAVLLTIGMLASTNLVVDPYGVFNTGVLPVAVEPSTYYNKIRHLEKNPRKYSGFILGSSAIGFTPTTIVEQYLPGIRFYNLWVSSATQYENLAHLKYLIKAQSPQVIYLQVDLNLGLTAYRHGHSQYARRLHPVVEGENLAAFLFEYLTVFPIDRLRDKISANLAGRQQVALTDFTNTGTVVAKRQDALIAADPKGYVKHMPTFHSHHVRTVRGRQTKRSIDAIRSMHELCRQHRVRLIVFIHPEHQMDMDGILLYDYLDFLKQLTEVTGYWDFSGYNTVTKNDFMYYEPGHYMPAVSRLIAARIFNDGTIDVPKDFGVYVTKFNFDRHASILTRQFADRDTARSTF